MQKQTLWSKKKRDTLTYHSAKCIARLAGVESTAAGIYVLAKPFRTFRRAGQVRLTGCDCKRETLDSNENNTNQQPKTYEATMTYQVS